MNFGKALENLKEGKKLTREGWNGKGMLVVLQRGYPEGIACNKQTTETSTNDVLAEDWIVNT